MMSDEATKMNVTDADIRAISDAVGMGPGAWDCVDPKEIVAAAWNEFAKKLRRAYRA